MACHCNEHFRCEKKIESELLLFVDLFLSSSVQCFEKMNTRKFVEMFVLFSPVRWMKIIWTVIVWMNHWFVVHMCYFKEIRSVRERGKKMGFSFGFLSHINDTQLEGKTCARQLWIILPNSLWVGNEDH